MKLRIQIGLIIIKTLTTVCLVRAAAAILATTLTVIEWL
jgi:hypothetical protein